VHRLTWAAQILFGVFFIAIGVVHLVLPPDLPELYEWMYDLPTWVHWVSGLAEIAGGLGLILPGLTRIKPQLTPLAASGLFVIMVLAAGWHLTRGDAVSIAGNLVSAAVLAVIAIVRWRTHPISAR
jgi:uncharacterized membrane protein